MLTYFLKRLKKIVVYSAIVLLSYVELSAPKRIISRMASTEQFGQRKRPEEESRLSLVPLHYKWELIDQTEAILQAEWPKSDGFRRQRLQESNDNLPVSLILVYTPEDEPVELVVGHARVRKIPHGTACFVESVIIVNHQRNRGWGRFMMERVENFIQRIGRRVVYLMSTDDSYDFYYKLGYRSCELLTLYGVLNKDNSIELNRINEVYGLQMSQSGDLTPICTLRQKRSRKPSTSKAEIPPPPPPPPLPSKLPVVAINKPGEYDDPRRFMKKILSEPEPPESIEISDEHDTIILV